MSADEKIRTRCPVCRTPYQVPNRSLGHRARCPKCDSVFRVVVQGLGKPGTGAHPKKPTEDDILGWLMEGDETDDLPPEPRRWQMASAIAR